MAQHIEAQFTNELKGQLVTSRGAFPIGTEQGEMAPYDMLLGALSACLYATFLHFCEKKKVDFERAHIDITGEKRVTTPMTLKETHITITIHKPTKEEPLRKAFELATKHCSIYETISKVSKMSYTIQFEEE